MVFKVQHLQNNARQKAVLPLPDTAGPGKKASGRPLQASFLARRSASAITVTTLILTALVELTVTPPGEAIPASRNGSAIFKQNSPIERVVLSADGALLAAATKNSVNVLYMKTATVRFSLKDASFPVAISPDGARLATRGKPGRFKPFYDTTYLWDLSTGKLIAELKGGWDVAFSRDSRLLATAANGVAEIWNAQDGKEVDHVTMAENGAAAVAFSPDARTLAASSGRVEQPQPDHGMILENFVVLHTIGSKNDGTPLPNAVFPISFSPDGKWVATAHADSGALTFHTALLWSLSEAQASYLLKGHTGNVSAIDFSPDGSLLATASEDHTARIWKTGAGKSAAVIKGFKDKVDSVAFSNDGTFLSAGSLDGTVRVWDLKNGRAAALLHAPSGSIRSLVFLPNASTLATGGGDGAVRLWSVER